MSSLVGSNLVVRERKILKLLQPFFACKYNLPLDHVRVLHFNILEFLYPSMPFVKFNRNWEIGAVVCERNFVYVFSLELGFLLELEFLSRKNFLLKLA